MLFCDYHESKFLQNSKNLPVAQGVTQYAMNLRNVQRNRGLIEVLRDDINDLAVKFATCRVEDQFSNAITRKNGGLEIRPTLKNVRSIGVQTVTLRHFANRDRVP